MPKDFLIELKKIAMVFYKAEGEDMLVRAFPFFSFLLFCFVSCSHLSLNQKSSSVIFFHPDGMSLSHWDLGRLITKGPDGLTSWDQMPHIAIYKAHLKNNLVATSNAGASIHAYGIKFDLLSFGIIDNTVQDKVTNRIQKNNLNSKNKSYQNHTKNKNQNEVSDFIKSYKESQALDSRTGTQTKRITIMQEAQQKGLKTGLVQSGHLMEPGTAVFASSAESRESFHTITEQLIYSDIDILLGAGEKHLLPKGVKGYFGKGVRTDKRNLIQEAKDQGYFVIYTLEELKKIPKTSKKVLGVFALNNTYNDETEEILIQKGLKPYDEKTPTIAEMSKYALEFLTREDDSFFLVVEEEGTDNFSNKNNAEGLFSAIRRSLKAVDFFRGFLKKNKNTLLIVASDSNASSPALISHFSSKKPFTKNEILPNQTRNGSPLDRKRDGAPFLSQPDKTGLQMPFAIAWPTKRDVGTGVVVKAEGYQAHKVKGVLDNTELYHIMRQTLFD